MREEVPKGAYVCEYPSALTYPCKERVAHEAEYTQNGEGCYILDCQTKEVWICLDGTRAFSYVGRYLNHAPRSVATLTILTGYYSRPLTLIGRLGGGATSSSYTTRTRGL